ncbi:GMC family oxidoreductase [Dyadobacter sp. CY351]|uniref:GMC family oxidoreductase n=1 Tax=Dyadobacter sp. CY351 TaxID=2909337 RepID=UPI001F384DD7|nr:GMC family oxidoreductase N-terminal domain-containing protein [Dyadobacter sp. CY351]MCF2519624.1 GMC family oxidoreductase N-terminal domain-containing protein [Dyadobacter sp. CY351]
MEQPGFDYIIVGAGAAGSVLANRLSADPQIQVLLIEAGSKDTEPAIHDPGGFVSLWGSDLDWNLSTTDQPGLGGRAITINQGKVLGGGTAINAMMYVRGNPANFNEWEAMGATGWGYQSVLPYFKKSENFENGASEFHATGGELSIRECPDDVMRSDHFLIGATQLGYDGPNWDYNGARQENGAGLLQFHIDNNNHRDSSASAFLHNISERKNLTIYTNVLVSNVLIDDRKAIGVEFLASAGNTEQVFCSKEVILSAGALHTPKILLLSGIGPANELDQNGIPVVADLPGVGKNLQDHLQLPMIYRSKIAMPNTTLLTGNALFVKVREESSVVDLQINFTPSLPGPLAPVLPDLGGPVCIFLPILVQPKSRGEVTLRSANPADKPVVNPNYLDQEADVEVLSKAVELVRKLANTPKFLELNGGEMVPGTDADIEAFVRSQSTTIWHPAGTCKMGTDAMAVVDAELRVHGIQNLRVADASVMPTVTSGNTVAACFMIGEKAADMILAAHPVADLTRSLID